MSATPSPSQEGPPPVRHTLSASSPQPIRQYTHRILGSLGSLQDEDVGTAERPPHALHALFKSSPSTPQPQTPPLANGPMPSNYNPEALSLSYPLSGLERVGSSQLNKSLACSPIGARSTLGEMYNLTAKRSTATVSGSGTKLMSSSGTGMRRGLHRKSAVNDFGSRVPRPPDVDRRGSPRVSLPDEGDLGVDRSFATQEDFDTMVGDLRRTFIGWLKRTESDLRKEREDLIRKRRDFEREMERQSSEWNRQVKSDMERLQDERKHVQSEMQSATAQMAAEREDARRKLNEERAKFAQEREKSRLKILQERAKFRAEHELFELERKRIVDTAIATETMVAINVGGTVFQSARHTFLQQPGSFLEALFSGRHGTARDSNGCFFIDRDAELFRMILNFLRDASVPPLPRDATESEALCKEAAFYNLKFFPFPLVFACGGHNGVEHLRAVEVLDVGQQCWRPCSAMETERTYHGGSVLYNRLHVFGGQNLDYKALCDVEIYDGLRDQWIAGPPLNVARRNLCGTVLGDRIFSIGGFDGSAILSTVEALDPRMKRWMELPPLTVPRSSCVCTALGENLYVFGGTKGERLRTGERFDSKMQRWSPVGADMIEVRSGGSACTAMETIFALGGTDVAHKVHASLEALDCETERWIFRKSMRQARMDASCTVVSDSIFVCGGQCGEVLDSTEFYRIDVDEWQPGPTMLFPRYGHTLLLANL